MLPIKSEAGTICSLVIFSVTISMMAMHDDFSRNAKGFGFMLYSVPLAFCSSPWMRVRPDGYGRPSGNKHLDEVSLYSR